MIPEIDIWRCAQLMVRRYGNDAANRANARAGELIEKGETAGGAVWQRIWGAIERLQNQVPVGPLHLAPAGKGRWTRRQDLNL